jgi:SAM-dependent MidA family methyltransferase
VGAIPWSQAMQDALYGPDGFYRRAGGPAAHFRTSVHASSQYAEAVARLVQVVDGQLGRPDPLAFVDVGAGRGELARAVLDRVGADLRGRLVPYAVEVAARPDDLPDTVRWLDALPPGPLVGLVVANEWLDNVPLDVVEATEDGVRQVLVEPTTGTETLGPAVDAETAAWLADWWPLAGSAAVGRRAEVGLARDRAWACVVGTMSRGVAVAMDYAHGREERAAGRYPAGTLVGYRSGRLVPPVPDGGCDLTAHVALDACAAAGVRAGATATSTTGQRTALRALGLSTALPPRDLAATDPPGYVAALSRASAAAELVDPAGLGGFTWLVQAMGTEIPAPLAEVTRRRPGAPAAAASP